jgi:hypothetical protein
MRDLTNEEVDKVAGGIAPALVGAMYIATHPTTIAGAKFAGAAFVGGAFGGAGWQTVISIYNQVMK